MLGLPINIKELINGKVVEWERIEFKEGWNPKAVIRTMCAFANDINNWGGGYIIIGVDQKDGKPILPPQGLHQNQLDPIQKELLQLCNRITPKYFPVAQPYDFGGKHIFVIWVPGGDNRPYKAPGSLAKTSSYFYWVRRFSNTVKPKQDEEQLLFNLSAKIPFDDRVCHQVEIDKFHLTLITEFLSEIKSNLVIDKDTSIKEISSSLQIARGPDEYFKPLNVGLLFFTTNPEKFFPGAQIEVVKFLDDVGDNLIEKIFVGPIHTQVRSALRYIKDSIIEEKVIKIKDQAEAIRVHNYPYEAIEEALVNAVYHKSYEHRDPVEVSIRKDCIEILSYPGPLPPIDNEILKQDRVRARSYRNRRIGDFLKELNLTEGRGTGLPKIRKTLRDNNSPEPTFETDAGREYFLVRIPINIDFIPKLTQATEQATEQVTEQVTEQATEQAIEQLGRHGKEILEMCMKPLRKREILKNLNLAKAYLNYKNNIMPLVKTKLLRKTKPDARTSPNQKYIITTLGKEVMKKINKE